MACLVVCLVCISCERGGDGPVVGVQGEASSMDYRIFFKEGEKAISPWHDIPLSAGGNLYNFVCEIPKESDAKMECATVRPSPRCSALPVRPAADLRGDIENVLNTTLTHNVVYVVASTGTRPCHSSASRQRPRSGALPLWSLRAAAA